MSEHIIDADVAIIGGGITGLWAYNILMTAGFKTVLIEKNSLGSGQTIASQGIIHSGIKYNLTGKQTGASNNIKEMPSIWKKCIEGNGVIDLKGTIINSNTHWLWPFKSISSKLTSFFASQAMQSRVDLIDAPRWFSDLTNVNSVYALDELVLNVPSLLKSLQDKYPDNIIKCSEINVVNNDDSNIKHLNVKLKEENININAKHFIFASGTNNSSLTGDKCKSQSRPLHMLWVKDENLPNLFGHVVEGLSSKPMLTITSHVCGQDNKKVWYIGGNIAEDGVSQNDSSLILQLQQKLSSIFPKLQLQNPEFGCYRVNRIEGVQDNGQRPDSYTINTKNNFSAIWPTKLALAPLCALEIKTILENKISRSDIITLDKRYPQPQIAKPIWEAN